MPVYESEKDRTNQARVAKILQERKGWDINSLPHRYVVDYLALAKGAVVAVLEIKCRTHKFGTYGTYMLSAYKHNMGNLWANTMNCHWLLCVQWEDVCKIATLTNKSFPVRWGGRADRGDNQDMEPVVHIPMSEFK